MRAIILSLLLSFSIQASECNKWVGPVHNSDLNEISGLSFSKIHSGIFYAHNDSGDKPRLFAMKKNGKHVAEFTIKGAKHVDWEDMAVMSCPGDFEKSCIAIGDFGNNRYNRKVLTIYIVEEPKNLDADLKPELPLYKKIEFKLDTAEQNFEGLFAHKDSLYLMSKMDGNAGRRYPGEEGKAILYKLNTKNNRAETVTRLDLLKTKEFYTQNEQGETVMAVPNYYSWVTGTELSPDGKKLYVLTYGIIFEYDLGPGGMSNPKFDNYKLIKIPGQPQVEAVAVNKSGVFVVSEYQHQPIYQVACY